MGPTVYQSFHDKCWLYHLGWFCLKEKETNDTADYSAAKYCRMELLMQQSVSTVGSALEHMKRTHEAVNEKESKHISVAVSLINNASNSNEQHDMEINYARVAAEEDVAKNSNDLFEQFDAHLFDKLVFDKTKQALGGRVRILLSGAAPLPRHVEEFMRVTSGSTLSQGYSLTKSCAGCFTAIGNVYSMTGTVGILMTTIEARLESVPEMGYDALSSVPCGEICLRGVSLFSGYHKRDIGEWQPNGAIKIIDRKKNIFKLSQGEYIAVESIENKYMQ
ncbi:Long chain acyl-CoA synthetase [Arachis hypogaea]|nr:Long chain acyl-CoA synthetase [Arachis hypogaea]